jgi:hypothetical protein
LRHGRGPVALQMAHTALDARLLLRLADQAKQRREGVVTGQGLVAFVKLSRPTGQQVRRDGARVVPPHFARHTPEEGEGLDQAVQDRLGALGRHGQGEGAVGVGPGCQQDRHWAAAVGEVDIDVAEVTLQALARIVVERDERRRLGPPLGKEILPDALVAAGIAVLVAQASEDLGARVPLLAWRRGVGLQDGVDDGFEGIDDGGQGATAVGLGFGLGEDLADLAAGMMEAAGELPDAHVLDAMGMANACVLVHLDHPPPPADWNQRYSW